jgi:acyl carrier protein
VIERVIEIVGAVLRRAGHNPVSIEPESNFVEDLKCDGLDMLGIELLIEDEFDLVLPEAVEHCETVGDLARMVEDFAGRKP